MISKIQERQELEEKDVNETKNLKNPKQLLMSWILTKKFKETENTKVNVKLLKNKEFFNARMLVKSNDYRINDDSVTINFEITLKGLIELNKFSYEAIKTIKEHMKEKEKKN